MGHLNPSPENFEHATYTAQTHIREDLVTADSIESARLLLGVPFGARVKITTIRDGSRIQFIWSIDL